MFAIGDFARHGRVSVRMLRHYDATGLLRPAHVDPATGYCYYTAAQLARLNRVIALKDLGFTLRQVQLILDEKVTTEELRAMLRLRRAELEAAMTAAAARLAQVEARLRSIESEGQMAATVMHRGSMDAVLPTVQTLGRWIDAHGYRSIGYPREINLEFPDDHDEWVTELQEPVTVRG
ncbi:MerR family transcriptional regulator [Nonomuraea sp. AD125B]|uniref:MerR family transcriptional regulator n=1 Tax=Nonomuraea sp. AD125B TaxID=3242897 RepID=UPI003528E8F6